MKRQPNRTRPAPYVVKDLHDAMKKPRKRKPKSLWERFLAWFA